VSFGLPVDVSPQEAITQELHRTAGSVAWLTMIVGQLERDGIVTVSKTERRTGAFSLPNEAGGNDGTAVIIEGRPSVWVELWQKERAHLVAVSTAAHKMGIDVAQTKIIETAGQMLAAAIMRILDRISLSEEQQVIAGTVVPEVLRSLEPAGEKVGS
jgi:hypothetical protein